MARAIARCGRACFALSITRVNFEPAPDPLYRQGDGGAAHLSDPVHIFFTMKGAYIGQNNTTESLLLVGLGIAATTLRFAD